MLSWQSWRTICRLSDLSVAIKNVKVKVLSLESQQNVWVARMLFFRTKRSRTLISVLLLFWMTAVSAPRYSSAQAAKNASPRKTWATLEVDKAQQSKNERNVRNILRKPTVLINEENTEILEKYLRRYFFARMTRGKLVRVATVPVRNTRKVWLDGEQGHVRCGGRNESHHQFGDARSL